MIIIFENYFILYFYNFKTLCECLKYSLKKDIFNDLNLKLFSIDKNFPHVKKFISIQNKPPK